MGFTSALLAKHLRRRREWHSHVRLTTDENGSWWKKLNRPPKNLKPLLHKKILCSFALLSSIPAFSIFGKWSPKNWIHVFPGRVSSLDSLTFSTILLKTYAIAWTCEWVEHAIPPLCSHQPTTFSYKNSLTFPWCIKVFPWLPLWSRCFNSG